ncbi:MAG: helix-turn-helix domain-containing protein [Verrucomicrobiales bacterium]
MKTENTPIFVRSEIDDAGLSPSEFRVYARIARRGDCYERVGSIAKGCLLHPDTVRKAVKKLKSLRLISIRPRPGFSNKMRILPYDKSGLSKIRVIENDGGVAKENDGRDLTENNEDKGNPPKEIPLRKSHFSDFDFDLFWKAYPRKVSKQNALKAFTKIKGVSLREILSGIESQKIHGGALARDTEFIPHPATWLSGRRWEDEPPRCLTTFDSNAGEFKGKGGFEL